jgi:glycosyltransferase involved in cell wall biosynthesis
MQCSPIFINDKYDLCPLLKVDQDDIVPIFEKGLGVYICNFPDQEWYDFNSFKRTKNYSIEKKEMFFSLMNKGSVILSPTQDSTISKPTKSLKKNNVIHIGSPYIGRVAQLHLAIKIIIWLAVNRKSYDYCLIYNFSPAEIFAAFFAKKILKKTVIVDFEDDILLQTRNKHYARYFNLVKNIPDSVICINKNMIMYFKHKKTYVFNGFVNLDYTKNVNFELKDGMVFLYAGALDEIRGVDLIPDLVGSLKKKLNHFSILITGSGPLETKVNKWSFKEVSFLGFLNNAEYEKVLSKVDACLVLQKPDHPFSLGSFPSKIEYYSRHKKPIYKIELKDVFNIR